jgi:hypothetical protein
MAVAAIDFRQHAPQRKLHAAIQTALHADRLIRVENGAAIELPSNRPDVRIFMIARLSRATTSSF